MLWRKSTAVNPPPRLRLGAPTGWPFLLLKLEQLLLGTVFLDELWMHRSWALLLAPSGGEPRRQRWVWKANSRRSPFPHGAGRSRGTYHSSHQAQATLDTAAATQCLPNSASSMTLLPGKNQVAGPISWEREGGGDGIKMVEEKDWSSPSLIKATTLQPTAEQPPTNRLQTIQEDILLQKTKRRPHQEGRRGDYMI